MTDVRSRVEVKKAELDRLRPLARRGLAALAAWYDVELTYTSNAIEGNTLTRVETAEVIEKGLTIGGKPLKDHLEAIGHKEALRFVRDLAQREDPVRESDVRQIHALILMSADPSEAGKYSDHDRVIKGSPLVLPSAWELKPLMSDFGVWLSAVEPGPEAAFDAHAKLVTIHPFSDGNGRTARLLMNLLLLRAGYAPVVIGPEHRIRYLDSLQALQLHGHEEPYKQFLYERLESGLDEHLRRLHPDLEA
ncbi:MAG: Fic family protein [Acidobacteriaceae bacterium]|nr:Fic family protein [Acidobacteriaceae bacterium]